MRNSARYKGGKVNRLKEALISQVGNMGTGPLGQWLLFPSFAVSLFISLLGAFSSS